MTRRYHGPTNTTRNISHPAAQLGLRAEDLDEENSHYGRAPPLLRSPQKAAAPTGTLELNHTKMRSHEINCSRRESWGAPCE